MNTRCKNNFKFLVLIGLVCVFPGCILGQLSQMGFTISNQASNEDLNESLSGDGAMLFDDGPIEMPVTISKLDGPDAELIDVEVSLPADDVVVEPDVVDASLGQLNSEIQVVSKVVGGAGSVYDPTQTPYVIAYRLINFTVDTESEIITEVMPDGSFEFDMISDERSQIILATLSSDKAYSSPFLGIDIDYEVIQDDSSGVFTIITTNSEGLNTSIPLRMDYSRYYYLSLDNQDGTYTLLRRNLDGSPVEVISKSDEESIDHIKSITYKKVVIVTSSGNVEVILPNTLPRSEREDVDYTNSNTSSYRQKLTTLEDYESEDINLFMDYVEEGIYISSHSQGSFKYIKLSNGNVLNVIPEDYYEKIYVMFVAITDEAYVLGYRSEKWQLVKMTMENGAGRAWKNRDLLASNLPITEIYGLSASINGHVFVEFLHNAQYKIAHYSKVSGFDVVHINDDESETIKNINVDADGQYIVACLVNEPESANQIIFSEIGATSYAENYRYLTSDDEFSSCNEDSGSMFISPGNIVNFYRVPFEDGVTSAQHAVINITDL